MGKVNLPRVILGGVLAGIIINLGEFLLNAVVLKVKNEEAMKSLGKTMPEGGSTMAVWVLWGFAAGIVAVWLYAAIRPRYGAGFGTAVRAGLAVWFLAWFLSMLVVTNMGLLPFSAVALVWSFVEALLATVAGAFVYREA